MLFDSWSQLGRVLVVGVAAYFALVLILRLSGKRTLSKFNAFDFIITIALGSTLATILLNNDIALAEGLAALALLVGLQYGIAWISVRSKPFQRLVKSEPKLLLYEGSFLDANLLSERLSRDEVMAAIRASGITVVKEVAAVILETDGSISVLPATHTQVERSSSTLATVDVSGVRGSPTSSTS